MRNSAKLSLAALVAALLLASAVCTCSAGRLSVNTQNIRTTWSRLEISEGIVNYRCHVTLEGSLHSRTVAKVQGALVGSITRVVINPCATGTLSPTRLPWHLTYESFKGALPNITGVRLLLNRAQIDFIINLQGLQTCRYGTATDNLTYELELNAELLAQTLTPVAGRNALHLLEGQSALSCPGELTQVAATTDGLTRILGTGGQIKITLI